jgi:activator of HSP90 ATPase
MFSQTDKDTLTTRKQGQRNLGGTRFRAIVLNGRILGGGSVTTAIQQSVEFGVLPEVLYELYMDSKKHARATGAPAKVSRKAGGAFTAFGGELKGKNLLIIPKKMIVQAWRATQWKKSDPDSILVIRFTKTKTGARVDLVHVNVPEYD